MGGEEASEENEREEKEEEEAVVFDDEVNPADVIGKHKQATKVMEYAKKSLGTFYPKTGYLDTKCLLFRRLGYVASPDDSYTDLTNGLFGWMLGPHVRINVDLSLYLLEVKLDLATLDHLGLDLSKFEEPLRFVVPSKWQSSQVLCHLMFSDSL